MSIETIKWVNGVAQKIFKKGSSWRETMKKIKCFVFFVLSVFFVSPLSAVAENFSSVVNQE